MNFRIADSFTDSLARLTGEEQKAAKTTAFDLQLNPANPGLSFHKLDRAKDTNFWSIRVNRDIRVIVHKSTKNLLLCYVDHHDKAYKWAERRKLETHPRTGAAQFVEVRETVREIVVPRYVEAAEELPPKPKLFESISEDKLLDYGVPSEWMEDVLAANEDNLLDLVDHLPGEAAEALLEIATGGTPQPREIPAATEDPFEHPDALRRFRVMTDVDELTKALDYPWEKWTIFLHPEQRKVVQSDFSGPARVAGSAGTGKTIVALHRAVHLADSNPDARVLLSTFSEILANSLRRKLARLISDRPRLGERIEVVAIEELGERLYRSRFGAPSIVGETTVFELIKEFVQEIDDCRFSPKFIYNEWLEVVDAWQLNDWGSYRDVKRLGRRLQLREAQREMLWSLFSRLQEHLDQEGLVTRSTIFDRLANAICNDSRVPFDYAVIDEAQDVSVAQLRFLAALGGDRPNALFFAGDLGQRIFQAPFSWLSLGVDIRGRSRTLYVNYRTSHQIRAQADRLLGPELADVDGNTQLRKGTVSVFNGVAPDINLYDTEDDETSGVAAWIEQLGEAGLKPREIGLVVRTAQQIPRARAAVEQADLEWALLDDRLDVPQGKVAVGTMHLAKGLEFRAIAVMACDDEVVPLQERIESVTDQSDLEEVYNTERHLLYVACTRARDFLLVSGVEPASEFLDDLLEH